MHSDWSEEEVKLLTTVRKSTELKIAAPLVEPWVMPCSQSQTSGCGPTGFGIELTNTVCNRLRIVCKFIYQNMTSSSDFQTELAHSIMFGGMDTSLPMLRPTPDLAVNLNFTTTAYFTEDAVLVRTEFVDPTDYLFVMKPFRPIVWVVIILSLAGVVFLDGLCQLAHEIDAGTTLNKLDILIRVENSWLYHLATLLQRSNDKPVFYWSRRFLIIGWGFSTLLLGSTYSAMLVSYRVAPTAETPYNHLDNLADALAEKKLKLLVFNPDSDFVRQIHQDLTNDNYKRFHDALKINPPVYTTNISYATNAVLSANNKVAFYGSLMTLRSIDVPNCTLTLVPLGVTRWGAYAFRKQNSLQYSALFTKVILSFHELGYYKEKLEQKYDHSKKCAEKVKSAQSSRDVTDVDTVNLLFVFLALICGYGAGMCVLLLEKMGVRCRSYRLAKKQRIAAGQYQMKQLSGK